MWLKEEGNRLIQPPVNYQTEAGWIMNFYKNPEAMTAHGWREFTREEFDAWYREHPEPVIPRTKCTKYELVTCLQKHFPELLETLKINYQVNPNLQFYWNSVIELDRANSDFQQLAERLDVTSEQLDAIFAKIE